ALEEFLPAGTLERVVYYIQKYSVHLTVTKERKRVLGNYRFKRQDGKHEITLNATLHPYDFLLTFLHELAHLQVFAAYQNRVEPHGLEWKLAYAKLMVEFVEMNVFPQPLVKAIVAECKNPSATANPSSPLTQALQHYYALNQNQVVLQSLPVGTYFVFDKNLYQILERKRTRYVCLQVQQKKRYLFSALTPVEELPTAPQAG
ncbi:MAG: hypothetical protein EAY72_14095, partial [Bacteroidetes bacterium]